MSKKNWIYGRNVVITGCSTGIGKQLTLSLVKDFGCNVMGVARNKQKLDALKEELGDKFDYRRFDIADAEAWNGFASELESIGFNTDVLLNNAGMIQDFCQFSDLDTAMLNKIVNTNFYSVLYGVSAFLPQIKKSNFGYIVNISSASAILPVSGETIYSATKAAVKAFSESLYQDLAGYGIGVSCVMPGPVKTDLYKTRDAGSADTAKKNYELVESIGITAETAAKRIIKAMRKRKMRVLIDSVAGLMDFGVRVAPSATSAITGKAMKAFCDKVPAFAPIFKDQIDNDAAIKEKLAARKSMTYKSLKDVPAGGPFGAKKDAE